MIDVNILAYSLNESYEEQEQYAAWLREWTEAERPFAVSELVLSSTIRIATHPQIFDNPLSLEKVLDFTDQILAFPYCTTLRPGKDHWQLFTQLCRDVDATGNIVPDAYFAALAIEHDCEWLSADKGFSRFPGLRWRHPLDD